MDREKLLRWRIKVLTWVFIVGLFLSGATALPLLGEVDYLVRFTGAGSLLQTAGSSTVPEWARWIVKVQNALQRTQADFPFLFYGTDWLAFGHFMIAIAFVGALVDPLRNRWLFTFGMIACILVIPYAMICGAARGIPLWWRLIDCSFGVVGIIPIWLCRNWAEELEGLQNRQSEIGQGLPRRKASSIAPSMDDR
jgi:hypothetical protein